MIDTEDLPKAQSITGMWYWDKHNLYVKTTIYLGMVNGKSKNTTEKLHTIIIGRENSIGMDVDHINHKNYDDRKCNLRISPHLKNTKNRKSRNTNNASGYRNVFWNNAIDKWSVRLSQNYKQIHIGDYDNVEEAGRVAEAARQKYYGEYAGRN